MSRIFDMKEQLAIGEMGAQLFHQLHPEFIKSDGRKGDFVITSPDERPHLKIELKADSYYHSKNYFMEYESHNKAGGPWKAMEDGCHFFVYMFVPEKKVYWFVTKQLVEWLNENRASYPVRMIQNKGWIAKGYLVSREGIQHLVVDEESIE